LLKVFPVEDTAEANTNGKRERFRFQFNRISTCNLK